MANSFRQIVEAPSQFFQELAQLVPWLSKLWRTLGQVEEWHEIGTSGEPAFENSWVNFSAADATAAFYKDPFGMVYVKGMVKTGTIGLAVFTLPVGYRPTLSRNYATVSNNAFGRLLVDHTNGQVSVQVGSSLWAAINCRFRAD